MKRPIPITVLALLAVFNGAGAWLLAALASAGSEAVWRPQGVGPNRIALADLFGRLRDYTAWLLAGTGLALVVLGVGLLFLKPWARWVTIAVVAGSAVSTLVVMIWGVRHAQWGVVAAGLAKVTVEIGLCYYLLRPARVAFGGGTEAA